MGHMDKKNRNQNQLNVDLMLKAMLAAALVLSISAILRKRDRMLEKQTTAVAEEKTALPQESAPVVTAAPSVSYFQNVVSKGDFSYTPDNASSFASGWTVYTQDGSMNSSMTFDQAQIEVTNAGSRQESSYLSHGGIHFPENGTVTVSFTASATINGEIRIMAFQGTTGASLGEQTFSLGPSEQNYSFSFTSPTSIWDGIVTIYFGGGDVYHSLKFRQIRILSSSPDESVRVNQAGYPGNAQKLCTFSKEAGDFFDVVEQSSGNIIYTGAIVSKGDDAFSGEMNGIGDFSAVKDAGSYYIRSQTGDVSPVFTIGADPYAGLSSDLLHFFVLQRCGQELNETVAGALAHGACHTENALLYGLDTPMDVHGGWHDAGDFGRYVKTGAKAAMDLMLAYMYAPDLWSDHTQSPDADNVVADILDEVRYELAWMLRMQQSDGSVFARASAKFFPGDFLNPADDDSKVYVLPADTSATGSFAGTMATAAILFAPMDASFSKQCQQAAQNAWNYLKSEPDHKYMDNPDDITSGNYRDSSDQDNRFFAAAALYAATGDAQYLAQAKQLYEKDAAVSQGYSWDQCGAYGTWMLAACSNLVKTDADFFSAMKGVIVSQGDFALAQAGNSYGFSGTAYVGGSNLREANNGIACALAGYISGEQQYWDGAMTHLSYLLGRNALNLCFVTGEGSHHPASVHNRLYLSLNAVPAGAVVGGPDADREDSIIASLPADTAPAKAYVDTYKSYSTNEPAIYSNSSVLALTTLLRK